MNNTKLQTILFERRDAVRRNLSKLLDKIENTIADDFMEDPERIVFQVNLDKAAAHTGFAVNQLEANLDLIYTGLLDKGYNVRLYADRYDSNKQYLTVSV